MLLALALASSLALSQTADSPRRVVAIVPYGKVDARLLDTVAEAIAARTNAEVRIAPVRDLPREAFYAPRKRWRAEKLLDALDAAPPPDAWKVVALTEVEISTTKGNIQDWGIGGLGNIGGRACVVSTYLLRKHSKTREVLARRLADLSVHELGHTLGLEHCPVTGCVMRDANGKLIRSIDASTGQFCGQCRRLVRQGVLKPPVGVGPAL